MFDPLPERADLTAELLAEQENELTAALTGTHDRYIRPVTRALFAAHRAAQGGEMPTDREAARYGAALQSYAVRGAVWMALDDDRLEGIELWVNLARRLPNPHNAAPLFLAAGRAYRDGNGHSPASPPNWRSLPTLATAPRTCCLPHLPAVSTHARCPSCARPPRRRGVTRPPCSNRGRTPTHEQP